MSLIDRTDPEENAKQKVKDLLMRPDMDAMDRMRIAASLSNQRYKFGLPFREPTDVERIAAMHPAPALVAANQLHEKLEADQKKAEADLAETERRRAALEGLPEWVESLGTPCTLEKNDCSRLHRLKEAMLRFRIIDGEKNASNERVSQPFMEMQNTFVIRHDWAAALAGSEVIANDFKFPYELCAFEFRLKGRTVILWCMESERIGIAKNFTAFIECGDYWYSPKEQDAREEPSLRFLWDQVKAICVALDAEVATHEVVRASVPLNDKRAKAGKPPLCDYRVVDLARRHRVVNPLGSADTGRRVRLHFRRGHWRHYDDHRTWIKWMLVGNPDLGFIQKHYSL